METRDAVEVIERMGQDLERPDPVQPDDPPPFDGGWMEFLDED